MFFAGEMYLTMYV